MLEGTKLKIVRWTEDFLLSVLSTVSKKKYFSLRSLRALR
jgi:hypothetical protein